jgi:hypothetical protein
MDYLAEALTGKQKKRIGPAAFGRALSLYWTAPVAGPTMLDRSNCDDTIPALVHELAERLQTLANYLGAARCAQISARGGHSPRNSALERAVGELARANDAFHRLRGHLASDSAFENAVLPMLRLHAHPSHANDSNAVAPPEQEPQP